MLVIASHWRLLSIALMPLGLERQRLIIRIDWLLNRVLLLRDPIIFWRPEHSALLSHFDVEPTLVLTYLDVNKNLCPI